MHYLIALAAALLFASCSHVAVSPIISPAGEPVVVGVRGVPKGEPPKRSQVMAINEALVEGITGETLIWKYLPELEGRGEVELVVLGPSGEATLKSGKKVPLYIPLVALRANAPPARVEEAAEKLGRDLYHRARKVGDIYPASQIARRPRS